MKDRSGPNNLQVQFFFGQTRNFFSLKATLLPGPTKAYSVWYKAKKYVKCNLFLVKHTVLCLQVKAVKKFSISYRETAKLLLLPEVSIKLRCCVVLQEITFLCCSLDPLQKTHVEKIQMLPPLLNNQCSVAIILQVIIIPPEVPGII